MTAIGPVTASWTRTGLALTALSALVLAGCSAPEDEPGGTPPPTADFTPPPDVTPSTPPPAPSPTPEAPAGYTITMEASSTSAGMVMWGDYSSTNSADILGDWRKSVEGVDPDDGYSVSVSGDYMDPATVVSCRILINGEVVDESTAEGAAASAYCSQPYNWEDETGIY